MQLPVSRAIRLVFMVIVVLLATQKGASQNITNGERTTTKPRSTMEERFLRIVCRKCGEKHCVIDRPTRNFMRATCLCKPTCLHETQCEAGVCQCPSGYSGGDCGTVDPKLTCSSIECHNGGICRNYGQDGDHCSCSANFTGPTCQTRVTNPSEWCNQECQKRNRVCHPLLHEGSLVHFTCLLSNECRVAKGCLKGYCEVNNTNDCICEECYHGKLCNFKCCKKCLNGGRCIIFRGEERCKCPTSPIFYTGDRCESRVEVTTQRSANDIAKSSRPGHTTRISFIAKICRKCKGKHCLAERSGRNLVKVTCLCKPTCLHETQCETGVCQCPSGYSGGDCGTVDPKLTCSSIECHNGGICRNYGQEGDHCSCSANFTGPTCQTRVTNPSEWCNQECQKRNRVCHPLLHEGSLVHFTCLLSNECLVGKGCQNGYCEVNNTNDCICEECYHGRLCDFKCCKKCLNGGRCIIFRGEERCECPTSPRRYKGERCETLAPLPKKPSTDYIYILIAAAVVLCALLVALIVVPYTLWKKRVLWIMRIVHKFQTPVEAGSKDYHAFVSYCGAKGDGGESPDELFVLRKLQKKLEGEYNFSLCLHYRDFTPGVAIAENIIGAVEKSHRTILVLSRRFVESEWCQLEYQKAQHEMLMRRHRIIPVMFEQFDLSEIKDKNLKDILKAVTYIVWPGDKAEPRKIQHFWKKLVYSMPKKGGRNLESYPSTSSEELSDLELQEEAEF